jgi:hypothetical protein
VKSPASFPDAASVTEEELGLYMLGYQAPIEGRDGGTVMIRKLYMKPAVREFLRILLAITISLGLGFIITLLVSEDPIGAYRAFLTGPVSRINRAGEWIKEAITLTLLGLSVALVFKAQLFSLGAEGQMLLGALVSGTIALFCTFTCNFEDTPCPDCCDGRWRSVWCPSRLSESAS